MEKNRICKICNKRFANGKAMGGHMRSHLAKLPLPQKPISSTQQPADNPPSPTSSSSTSSSSLNYPNTLKSDRSLNQDDVFSTPKPHLGSSSAAARVGGSDTDESPTNPTRRRSKRGRKSAEKVAESSEQVSTITHLFSEEDAAMCLVKLSRDSWKRVVERDFKKIEAFEHEEDKDDEGDLDDEDEADEDDDQSFGVAAPARFKSQGKYRCETCNKNFRSYQALGGHRASHKKMKAIVREDDYQEHEEGTGVAAGAVYNVEQRIFKCPFCDKIFDSGQALGGHKKVHFSYSTNYSSANAARASTSIPQRSSSVWIDLNVPAPEALVEDDDDDEEVSH